MDLLERLHNPETLNYRDYAVLTTLVGTVSIGLALILNEHIDDMAKAIPTSREVSDWIIYQLYR